MTCIEKGCDMARKIKILIVEDEALTALLLSRNLQLKGYDTSQPVATGEAAIQMAGADRPDVAIMDIRLAGGMDGIETAGELIARYNLPIIFMTGYSDEATINKAAALKPAAYLIKPVTPDHIEPVLVELFGKDG
jgi:CheY-like chemotaxis protein